MRRVQLSALRPCVAAYSTPGTAAVPSSSAAVCGAGRQIKFRDNGSPRGPASSILQAAPIVRRRPRGPARSRARPLVAHLLAIGRADGERGVVRVVVRDDLQVVAVGIVEVD